MSENREAPDAYREYVVRRRKAEELAVAHAAVQPHAPRRGLMGILWRVAVTVVLAPLALGAVFVGPIGAAVALGIAWLIWVKVWGGSYCTGALPVLPQDHGRIPGDPR
jgi:hypothetical protein